MQSFDIVIVGGGMVGAALANALAPSKLSIAVVEQHTPKSFSLEQPLDLRVSAISAASETLLTRLGAWSAIESSRLCPYRFLETWEGPGTNLIFDSQDKQQSHLGHIIENRIIQLALWQQFEQHDNIILLSDTTIEAFARSAAGYQLSLAGGQSIECRLLVGADGANSNVRQFANIGVTAWDYRQHAMLINITTQAPQQDITWQQFTASGPRAFLPLAGNHGSLVWYDSPARIRELSKLTAVQLKQEIVQSFPERLGEFEVDDWGAFPLTRRHAQQYVRPGLALVGDAAHTINPLAGQGVNLGFKDVSSLAQVICDAVMRREDWSSPEVLKEYEKLRRGDNLLMQSAMDLFYLTFSNELAPLQLLRGVGLKLANQSGFAKQQVMRYAMGL